VESRISAAKARANRANNVILVSAAVLFAAAVGAARLAHPARTTRPATTPSTSTTASSSSTSPADGLYDESGDDGYYGSGSIAPSQSVPQLSTGGS
jgi:hypothetical protein